MQGSEQVRVEQRGQRYFGGLVWLFGGDLISPGDVSVVFLVAGLTILSRARSGEGLSRSCCVCIEIDFR